VRARNRPTCIQRLPPTATDRHHEHRTRPPGYFSLLRISWPLSPECPKAHRLLFSSTSHKLKSRLYWRGEQSCFSQYDSLPCASCGSHPHISMGSVHQEWTDYHEIQRLDECELRITISFGIGQVFLLLFLVYFCLVIKSDCFVMSTSVHESQMSHPRWTLVTEVCMHAHTAHRRLLAASHCFHHYITWKRSDREIW
jgi:hypothetical protein